MAGPETVPLGLRLARAAKSVSRAFDGALAAAGGSRPAWLVLVSLKNRPLASQRELADAIGIRGPTLTHHLDVMESAGLVTRRRDPGNRRVQLVELTGAGDALFLRLRDAVTDFDQRLRRGIPPRDVAQIERYLDRLRDNVTCDNLTGDSVTRGNIT
jgi:MarR family transcriptional regulator, transcriptional regulator for hemolysin